MPDELRPIDPAAELPPLLATLNATIPDACDRIEWAALAAAADWHALRHVLRPVRRHAESLGAVLRKDGSDTLTVREAAELFGAAELLRAARNGRMRADVTFNYLIACVVREDADVVNRWSQRCPKSQCWRYHTSVLPRIRRVIALFVGTERIGPAFADAIARLYPLPHPNARADAGR
jgi:hypothetical protein